MYMSEEPHSPLLPTKSYSNSKILKGLLLVTVANQEIIYLCWVMRNHVCAGC